MIIVIGRAEVDPSTLKTLRPALEATICATFEDSGRLSCSLAIESDGADGRPAVLTLAERRADEAALKAHFAAPHVARFKKVVEGALLSFDAKMFDATNERPFAL